MISDSTVNHMIRVWKQARISCDGGALAYPPINILHPEHGVAGAETPDNPDVDFVQQVVSIMPPHIRRVFEAYHVGVLEGTTCRTKPHKWRAMAMGMGYSTYMDREELGRGILKRELLTRADFAS